jgi:hypothetical protein
MYEAKPRDGTGSKLLDSYMYPLIYIQRMDAGHGSLKVLRTCSRDGPNCYGLSVDLPHIFLALCPSVCFEPPLVLKGILSFFNTVFGKNPKNNTDSSGVT